jgi:hypothetical protein
MKDRRRRGKAMMGVSRLMRTLAIVLMGATSVMAQTAAGAPATASEPHIDPRVRTFLAEHSSPFFWELLPAAQVRGILTDPQAKTPVDLSGVTIAEKTILRWEKADGRLLPTSYGAFSRPTNWLGE